MCLSFRGMLYSSVQIRHCSLRRKSVKLIQAMSLQTLQAPAWTFCPSHPASAWQFPWQSGFFWGEGPFSRCSWEGPLFFSGQHLERHTQWMTEMCKNFLWTFGNWKRERKYERDVIMWQRYGNVFCATRWVLSSWMKLGVTRITRTNGWTNCLHLHLGLSENRVPRSIQWFIILPTEIDILGVSSLCLVLADDILLVVMAFSWLAGSLWQKSMNILSNRHTSNV